MFSKFGEQGLMEEVLDVFCVVEGCERCGGLVDFLLVARFAWVDAFEDA